MSLINDSISRKIKKSWQSFMECTDGEWKNVWELLLWTTKKYKCTIPFIDKTCSSYNLEVMLALAASTDSAWKITKMKHHPPCPCIVVKPETDRSENCLLIFLNKW